MNVRDALKRRHAARAFLDRPVPRAAIERLLEAARRAPSGANTQPWEVFVVCGDTRRRLLGALEQAYRSGQPPRMDYHYYPERWREPFRARQVECGRLLYETLGIARGELDRRREQWIANYRAFGAPAVLFFAMPKDLEAGSYMDMGMFIQSVMLAACEEGLASCPQAALGQYPDIVREHLGIAAERFILCGLALGYEDTAARVNGYRTTRVPVSGFAKFFE
ncbi:MAG: nitroreductase [Proteobacteria bacterium]|nr:MAG: nitroreductase [Pseudomonadota bacterium]